MKAPTDPHETGLTELIRIRGEEQLQSPAGRSLFRVIQAKRQIRALDGTSFQPTRGSSDTIALSHIPVRVQLWQLLYDVSDSCSKIQNLISQAVNTDSLGNIALIGALQNAYSIYSRLLLWQNTIPADWIYGVLSLDGLHEAAYPSRLYFFNDIHQGATWMTFWCSRIHLLEKLIEGQTSLQNTGLAAAIPSHNDLHTDILTVVDDICASGPYMLGEINEYGALRVGSVGKGLGAFYFLRGLHVANMVDDIECNRRRWIRDCLLKIGHSRGIKMALRSRNRYMDKGERTPEMEFRP